MDLARLEREALLLGLWKNVEDLEMSINLPELEAILEAHREKIEADRRFMAAIQGVDLDEGEQTDSESKFDEIQRRADAILSGSSEQELEFDELGIEIETE